MENKKKLIVSIVGIIVLVIAVIGISFAMYSFTGTGTKENFIQTGTVSMSFDPDNNFEVSGQYPMSDAKGVATTTNKATFGVNANWGASKMTISYDLGITDIEEGDTLTAEHIKVALLDDKGAVIVGKTDANGKLSGGVTIASLANKAGANNLITSYALTSGTITISGTTDNYTILAYVADTYDLPTDKTNTTTDNGGNQTTSGFHKEQTGSETFKFKIGIKATQVTGEEQSI